MAHHDLTPDDMADLLHHRATLGAVIWAVLLLAACVAALVETPADPTATQLAAAAASAASAVPDVHASSEP